MRVLHAPINIAGQANTISRAQRQLGIQSDVLVFDQTVHEFECDYDLGLNEKAFPRKFMSQFQAFLRIALKYDIIHFHFGMSLLPGNLDLYLLKALGKKTLMHYWGSDIIQFDLAKKYTLIDEDFLRKKFPPLGDEKRRRRIDWINRMVDISIVGDYSLLPFSPNSLVIRQALLLSSLPFVGCDIEADEINIVHAPTNKSVKGTDLILAAIRKLKEDGFNIKLTLIENMPHHEAIDAYKKADIVIDDVLQGPYGIFAMECMALGKPVLCRIDPHFADRYENLPIVNTPPDRIFENLRELIERPGLRKDLGKRGRIYIEKNHDARMIAQQLIDLYKLL